MKAKPVFFGTEKEKAGVILNSIKEIMPAHVDLAPTAFLSNWEDFPGFQEDLEGADVILDLTENIRAVPLRLLIRLGDFGLPLVLFGGDYYLSPRRLEATGYWKAAGVKVYLAATRGDLRDQLGLLAAKHRIQKTRALLIGSRFGSPYVVTSSPDFAVARRSLGVEILCCTTSKYLRIYGAVKEDQASSLAKEWMGQAEQVREPSFQDLQKSARFYLTMRSALEECDAGAVAINCLPFTEEIQGTPCLALVRLNDEGIPAACEGDLTALMTMIFLERLAKRPAFMGNIIHTHPDQNIIALNHCVFPFRMRGYEEPRKPYIIRDYHGRGMGACAAYEPEMGITVTIARFDTRFEELVFTTGQLVGHGEDYCRTNLRVKIPDVRAFIRQVRGNHHILVYGDHTEGIRMLCGELGITPVSVDSPPQ